MNWINKIVFLLFLALIASCKKEKKTPEISSNNLTNGMLVVNEGLMNLNNATVAWVNFADGSVNTSFFTQQTGRMLGDTGNDMKRYGGKIYIVVNVSSTIEVMDAKNFKPIKQISMLNGGTNKQPRFVEFYNGKALISCFDGYVDVLDTASLEIEKRIPVGTNPDQLLRVNDQLFVSNSGGLNVPLMDSTVSVVDLASMLEIKKIKVGMNPGSLAYKNGSVYVVSRGNYYDVPARMKRIDVTSLEMVQSFDMDVSRIADFDQNLILVRQSSSTAPVSLAIFNPISNTVTTSNFIDISNLHTFFGIDYIPSRQQFYIRDAEAYTNSGYVHIYSVDGTFIRKFKLGLNPTAILNYD